MAFPFHGQTYTAPEFDHVGYQNRAKSKKVEIRFDYRKGYFVYALEDTGGKWVLALNKNQEYRRLLAKFDEIEQFESEHKKKCEQKRMNADINAKIRADALNKETAQMKKEARKHRAGYTKTECNSNVAANAQGERELERARSSSQEVRNYQSLRAKEQADRNAPPELKVTNATATSTARSNESESVQSGAELAREVWEDIDESDRRRTA